MIKQVMNSSKLLLIDGNNFFHRYYHVAKKNNWDNNKLFSFIKYKTFKIIKYLNINLTVFCFDSYTKKKTFLDYKQNRILNKELEQNLLLFIDYISKYFKITKIDNMEADDIIGIYTYKLKNICTIYINTLDQDMYQLIDKNVFIVKDSKTPIVVDSKKCLIDLKIKPDKIVFYKMLVGDSSDNIKGVPKIGKQSAIKVVNYFNNKEEFFNNLTNNNLNLKEISINFIQQNQKYLNDIYNLMLLKKDINEYKIYLKTI